MEALGFALLLGFGGIFAAAIALKARTKRRNIQHHATTLTVPLTALGFFLFKFFPAIMNAGWGWVPQF